jgi:class 3 adenylate cyclase
MEPKDSKNNILRTSYYALEDIATEFLKYAPAYAQQEAKQAIEKVMELQMQGVLRNGLYYIVLVDLVGSTVFCAQHGNDAMVTRLECLVRGAFSALNEAEIKNVGLFVKEIGDAVLFIFHHFPDILKWRTQFEEALKVFGKISGEPFVIRTCIHVGEVFLQGVNPLSLAVSQTFKMEKQVGGGEIVLTEFAYSVAWPTIARAYHGFERCGEVAFDGVAVPVGLYRLQIHDEHDAARIVQEQFD